MNETQALEAEIELGVMFAKVKASVVFGQFVGAHVDLDGNVLGDTGLVSLREGADAIDIVFALHRVAHSAVKKAHAEIGLALTPTEARVSDLAIRRAVNKILKESEETA